MHNEMFKFTHSKFIVSGLRDRLLYNRLVSYFYSSEHYHQLNVEFCNSAMKSDSIEKVVKLLRSKDNHCVTLWCMGKCQS